MKVFFALVINVLLLTNIGWAAPEIHINIPELVLRLCDNGKLLKEYRVALGTPYEPTPTGVFSIFHKEKNPTWTPGTGFVDKTPVLPGTENPLGSRWMEFLPAYGIHGTNKDWDIEYPVSGGCVRMHNIDVEELYEIVGLGTSVIISYDTVILVEKHGALYLRVFPDIYNKNISTQKKFWELYSKYSLEYETLPQVIIPEKVIVPLEIKVGTRRTFGLSRKGQHE